MKLKNSNYRFDGNDPVFSFNSKTYNANHLSDKQIGELIVNGCKIFKKEKPATSTPVPVSEAK